MPGQFRRVHDVPRARILRVLSPVSMASFTTDAMKSRGLRNAVQCSWKSTRAACVAKQTLCRNGPREIRSPIVFIARRGVPSSRVGVITNGRFIHVSILQKCVAPAHAARSDEKRKILFLRKPTKLELSSTADNFKSRPGRLVKKRSGRLAGGLHRAACPAHGRPAESLNNFLMTIPAR